MPNVDGLDVNDQYNVYASFILAYGDAAAIRDLRDGNRVIVGLRHETQTTANHGQGLFDDRIVVLYRETVGNQVVNHVESFDANTEPSAQYDYRAGDTSIRPQRAAWKGYGDVTERYKNGGRVIEGQDADGDGYDDLGRLTQGTYRYTKAVSATKGREVGNDGVKHILHPDTDNAVQRDSNGDGYFNGSDTGTNNLTEGQTMYFHPGGATNTFSAGCQTFQTGNWETFWTSLGDTQNTFSYVLRNMR
jgi:hypothetical protein